MTIKEALINLSKQKNTYARLRRGNEENVYCIPYIFSAGSYDLPLWLIEHSKELLDNIITKITKMEIGGNCNYYLVEFI